MGRRGSEVLGPMSEPLLSQAGKLAGTMLSLQVGTRGRLLAGVGEVRNALLSGWRLHGWIYRMGGSCHEAVSPRGPATLHRGWKC